jgi:hypothetical protein
MRCPAAERGMQPLVRRTARRSWRRCPGRHRALRATACGGGTGLERRLRTAGRRRGSTRTAAGQLGGSRAPCARRHATAPPTPVAAAPTATAVPAAPTAAPAIAPAPSCGAPDTRPVAMPGPKIPSASKVSEASMMTSAWSMDGSAGWTWNWRTGPSRCRRSRPAPAP